MTLWLCKNNAAGIAAVVRAETTKAARQCVRDYFEEPGEDEEASSWESLEDTSCVALSLEGESAVLVDYDFE